MNRHRLIEIQRVANELIDEIEVVGFIPYCGGPLAEISPALIQSTEFRAGVKDLLDQLFSIFLDEQPSLQTHQEIELEAVGLLQSAVKRVLRSCFPEFAEFRFCRSSIKVKRLPNFFVQAPIDVWVPSIADQLAGRQPVPAAPGGGDV